MVKNSPSALYTYLTAAQALAGTNQFVEAEIKYTEALRMATKEFGPESDQVVLVVSILAAFYRSQNRAAEAAPLEMRLAEWTMREAPAQPAQTDSTVERKFVGTGRTHQGMPAQMPDTSVRIPANLRHAAQMLGIPMETRINPTVINQAWKKQMLKANAHPDLGGNTEEAVLLNNAKIEMMAFLEARQPKLGAKFKKDRD